MGTGSFPGINCGRGVLLTTHPILVPRSWKSRATPLPTLWDTPGSLYLFYLKTQLIANITNMNEWLWSIGGMVLTGETRNHKELSQCHFVHHKAHLHFTKTESRPSRWQTGDWPPEPFTLQTRPHKRIYRVVQQRLLFLVFNEIWNVQPKFSKTFQRRFSRTCFWRLLRW